MNELAGEPLSVFFYRTAKEAKELEEKARNRGEKLPEEKRFDSNCITPGSVIDLFIQCIS